MQTVAELIDYLNQFDGDTQVVMFCGDAENGDGDENTVILELMFDQEE